MHVIGQRPGVANQWTSKAFNLQCLCAVLYASCVLLLMVHITTPAASTQAAAAAAAAEPYPTPTVMLPQQGNANGAQSVTNGTAAELYRWYSADWLSDLQNKTCPTEAFHCLAQGFKNGSKEHRVYSQYGEDGIIEFISSCIRTTNKYYVEFGTESCLQCTTRNLRDQGWQGLLLDGSNENASINLHKHFMTAENIAGLFKQYNVPHPSFDHLTVDVDLNTPYLLRAVLDAGYRPRQLVVEYNRNFESHQSYMVLYSAEEVWETTGYGTCYYSASGLAMERLVKAYNYSLVAFDSVGVNMFFVRNDILGMPFPHTYADVTPVGAAFAALHADCKQTVWVYVEDSPHLAGPDWLSYLHPVMLNYKVDADAGSRKFYEARSSYTMHLTPCAEHQQDGEAVALKRTSTSKQQGRTHHSHQQRHRGCKEAYKDVA